MCTFLHTTNSLLYMYVWMPLFSFLGFFTWPLLKPGFYSNPASIKFRFHGDIPLLSMPISLAVTSLLFFSAYSTAFNSKETSYVRLSLRHGSCSGKSTSSDCCTSVVKEYKRVDREALHMDSSQPGLYLGPASIFRTWPLFGPGPYWELWPLLEPSFYMNTYGICHTWQVKKPLQWIAIVESSNWQIV